MTFEEINLHLDSLLALFEDPKKARLELMELYDEQLTLVEFLREFVAIHDLGEDAIYSMKVWFGLSYKDLALVFGRDEKQISQVIRNHRTAALPPYKSEQTEALAGLSCFMVDQLLGALIDLEVAEISVLKSLQAHLDQCPSCRSRCELLRASDTQKLKERKVAKPFQPAEWEALLGLMKERRSFDKIQALVLGALVLVTLSFTAWFFISKPTQVLNVYEMSSH